MTDEQVGAAIEAEIRDWLNTSFAYMTKQEKQRIRGFFIQHVPSFAEYIEREEKAREATACTTTN